MKTICTLMLIVSSFLLSNVKGVNQNGGTLPVLKAIYRGNYNFPKNDTSGISYFLVEVKLINTTCKPIEFITFNCTPNSNIVLKSKDFKICPNNCAGNGYYPVKLNPGQEFSIPVILESNKKDVFMYLIFGWALLNEENTTDVDNYLNVLQRAKTKYENVIWSNQLELSTISGEPIIIK